MKASERRLVHIAARPRGPAGARCAATASAAPTDACAAWASGPGSWAGSGSRQPAGVQRGVHAADHRHAEGAAEQPGGVVDGGADAGLGRAARRP